MKKICIYFIVLLFAFACSAKKDSVKKTPSFDTETAFKQVDEKMKIGRFEEAREILDTIKTKDTSGEYVPVAQIRTGDTYFKEGLYEEASVEYGHFLKIHVYHKYAPYAQYQLAMTYFKRIKTIDVSYSEVQKALQEFEKLLKRYPRNPYINLVENRIKTCKDNLAEYEFYVGKFYFKKGSYGAAAGRFNDLLLEYPDSKMEMETLYYLGLSYKNSGEKDKSLKALTTLIEKYPAASMSQEAHGIIASLGEKRQ